MKKYVFSSLTALLLGLNGCLQTSDIGQYHMDALEGEANIIPLAVIGSGPAGLMASIYGARGGKPTYLFEGNKPGGLLMDTTQVENWPGETSIQGPQIIEKLKDQAMHYGVHFIDDALERIDLSSWPYTLYTEGGHTMSALSVVIATGATPRRLGVPGEDRYWGSGVTSCAVCDAPFFKHEQVVVVGGGDSAVEEAIQLAAYADSITILVRKDHMRAAASMQERLKEYPSISVRYNVQVKKIVGDEQGVTGIELYDTVEKKSFVFTTRGVFLAIGHDPNSQLVKDQLRTLRGGYIYVEGHTQETSKPGVFAAGDVQDNRYRQASSSAGDGTNAGLDAVRFLDECGFTPQVAERIHGQLYGSDEGKKGIQRGSAHPIVLYKLRDIEAFRGQRGVVALQFWAPDCPQCSQMVPIFTSVAAEYADRIQAATVQSDMAHEATQKLFVNTVPTLLIYKDGDLVARYTGVMGHKELRRFLDTVKN